MDSQYLPGDVLVFKKVDNYPLGDLIAFMTDSDVFHAALVYGSMTTAELGFEGIFTTEISTDGSRPAYHMRHKTQEDMTKVIDAAKVYLDKHIPYDHQSLVFIAGLIIYHKYFKTPKYKAIVDTILGIACWSLDKYLNDIIHGKNSDAMMCSQFVYQCFYDAGGNYRLNITNGVVFGKRQTGETRLVDLLNEAKSSEPLPEYHIPDTEIGEIDEESLAQSLLDALKESASSDSETSTDGNGAEQSMKQILSKADKFLNLLEKILETIGSKMPLPSLFVTPADLLCHTENLKEVKAE